MKNCFYIVRMKSKTSKLIKLASGLCMLFFLLTACSKKGGGGGSSANTWRFAGNNYTASSVVYINAGASADLSVTASGSTASDANGLVFTFTPPPSGNTQMLITNSNAPNTVLVTESKLSGMTTTFYSNDVTNVNATVTISNGKVGITFPGTIWLHNDGNFDDSAQISISTITEQ